MVRHRRFEISRRLRTEAVLDHENDMIQGSHFGCSFKTTFVFEPRSTADSAQALGSFNRYNRFRRIKCRLDTEGKGQCHGHGVFVETQGIEACVIMNQVLERSLEDLCIMPLAERFHLLQNLSFTARISPAKIGWLGNERSWRFEAPYRDLMR